MRAKPGIGRLLVIALIVSLVLTSCYGGTSGRTWFNFPSVKLVMSEDGSANLYGFNVGYVGMTPDIIQLLQSADVQRLEARIGYNGIHVYLNGDDMPYLAWDAEKTENLQEVLRALPPTVLPNSAMIANYLPWLRKIGLGVRFDIPPASMDIAGWKGETEATPETAGETTIGPIVIASLVFDENGEAYIEGIPASELEQMLGAPLPLSLDPNTLSILAGIGVETFAIATQPNGIDLFLNEQPLPGIAYDSQYLERALPYIDAFAPPETAELLNQIVPLLPGADIQVVVSFTGEPVAETDLGSVTVVVRDDGSLALDSGIPLPNATLPDELLGNLKEANVQQLGVSVTEDGLAITSNGQVLPTISFSEESLGTLAGLVAPMAGVDPALITEGLDIVKSLGADVTLDVPAAEGAEPVEIPEEPDLTMEAPDLGDINAPTIQLTAKYGDDGFTELGGISSDTLSRLGVSLPTLPPDLMNTLKSQGVSQLGIKSGDGELNVEVDGSTALTVNYDRDSLDAALELAAPFLGEESPLNEPVMNRFLREQILPLVPAANLDITLDLE